MPVGYWCPVLHAHLPYVRHPEHPHFLEEDWLFEAITETYVPLLQAFERLDGEGVPYRLTMTVTPPLASMLADELLESRYRNHLRKLRELVDRQVAENDEATPIGKSARFYRDWLTSTQEYVDGRWGGNLRDALREAQDRGHVELVTCTATHGLLPTMGGPIAQAAQVLDLGQHRGQERLAPESRVDTHYQNIIQIIKHPVNS